jgi:fructose-1,6-bisphosphatase I
MPVDRCASSAVTLEDVLDEWTAGRTDRIPLAAAVVALTRAGLRLAAMVAANPLPAAAGDLQTTTNADGDIQTPLDVRAEALFVTALTGHDVAAILSEETRDPIPLTEGGSLIVTLDPIDGSSNLDINAPVGTIFSILPNEGVAGAPNLVVLQPGRRQLAAGIIVYGPSTVMVLSVGSGTDTYVLDPDRRVFVRTRARLELPADSQEYAINAANARHWNDGITSYINDLVNGSVGPRGRDFNMRWIAALVADTYRILLRGGIFLYPGDQRPGYRQGRIRLVYEANPVAFLCEQAGGMATDGLTPILDIQPASLHQRTPLVFGSRTKVERVRRYLENSSTMHQDSPLFTRRGLFRS